MQVSCQKHKICPSDSKPKHHRTILTNHPNSTTFKESTIRHLYSKFDTTRSKAIATSNQCQQQHQTYVQKSQWDLPSQGFRVAKRDFPTSPFHRPKDTTMLAPQKTSVSTYQVPSEEPMSNVPEALRVLQVPKTSKVLLNTFEHD